MIELHQIDGKSRIAQAGNIIRFPTGKQGSIAKLCDDSKTKVDITITTLINFATEGILQSLTKLRWSVIVWQGYSTIKAAWLKICCYRTSGSNDYNSIVESTKLRLGPILLGIKTTNWLTAEWNIYYKEPSKDYFDTQFNWYNLVTPDASNVFDV